MPIIARDINTTVLTLIQVSPKKNGSIRYVLAGTLGSAPFDFMKRPAPKYVV